MSQDFYQLRIKYNTRDGELVVDYTTVGADSKESLGRSIAYHRAKHQKSALGDVEILVKNTSIGNTYFD